MQSSQPSATPTYRGALWLNGTAWALLVLGGLGVCLLRGSEAMLAPLLLMPLVAGLGALTNLFLGLHSFMRNKPKQVGPYLLGFLLLAGCLWGQVCWINTHFE